MSKMDKVAEALIALHGTAGTVEAAAKSELIRNPLQTYLTVSILVLLPNNNTRRKGV